MSDTNLRAFREKLVRDHMEDENRLDFDKVLATFPHPHYELIPTGAVHDGKSDVENYYASSRKAFPDQRNELISLRHADDAVVVEFWLRGTHLGPLNGIAPTGNKFECRMTAFFIFEGEKLIVERVYFDGLTMLKQLIGEISLRKPKTIVKALRTIGGLRKGLR